ncbi:Uncharacterized membrane protein YcaP, DUF421 family [Virgibacillus subterraneus]|uniref:Uncharacterized membrane protein YcaP, DUF421 family n=2 Tax=Virgibacillus TaxID=84406 RepID=A0A1H0Y5D3_9BACI|nr:MULTISPECIES: DUF421 domain-containing protein [Virgibacillus]SDQ10384.1 Uncharacterized membrane protein YcaP, DUF421 family [Virgibacillus salinus]SEP68270.1 Uncharacterized membrane protein YcaP, DUF421 family [Virgibacillus subterraneus]
MLETIKELLIILGRIVTILPLLLFVTIFMGKRAIGELPIFDFLIIVTLGAVVGADIADPNIHHLPTAFAIIAIAILQKIVAKWKISNRKIGKLLTFEPTIVIQNGKLLHKNMKQMRYSIDNILQMLREKSVFDLNEVETAIIEANGSLSVLKKASNHSVTAQDLGIVKTTSSITFPVIVEGNIYTNVLYSLKLDESWLMEQLASRNIDNLDDVFYASINYQHELQISLMEEQGTEVPPIRH